MTRRDKEEERKERIDMEIVVDANVPEEQAMGWYYYLSDNLQLPFSARCLTLCSTSPLELGDKVEVLEMGPAEAKP